MPVYAYRAIGKDGRLHKGEISTANENELARTLNDAGYELIRSAPRSSHGLARAILRTQAASIEQQRLTLCSQLADLLEAGIPLLTALKQIANGLPRGTMHDALMAITRDIAHGNGIERAFAAHPALFHPIFLACLKTGEKSGDLILCFRQIAEQLRWQMNISDKTRRALRYPLFLFFVAGSASLFMLMIVVPQIVAFLRSIGGDLPWTTNLLIWAADLCASFWWLVPLSFTVVYFTVRNLRRLPPALRFFTGRTLLTIPLLGPTLHKIALARFARSFALLLRNQISVPESLHQARATLDNPVLEKMAEDAETAVQSGTPLSLALSDLLPPFATHMLQTGEETGDSVKSLENIVAHFDGEVSESVERMVATIEPALTVGVGLLLAWVVLAVLGPIYGSVAQLGHMQ